MVYSPVASIRSWIFRLEEVDAWALPPAPTVMPQPPAQVTLPDRVRSADGSTPLVSKAIKPVPVSNSYLAMTLASKRLAPLAIVPWVSPSGANRFDANVIAKYEFETGTGLIAFDTS